MGIKTKKILRLISKIVLIVIGLGLLGYVGYFVYRSIVFKPQNIVITNITDSSATITWITKSPMKGIAYFKKDGSLLPGPLAIVNSNKAYDDRDVSDAQKTCVDDFNKQASETKDTTFTIDGSNYDCTNVKVTKVGDYYTHSVTMMNLDENSTYDFVVGNGIWSFKETINTVKTFSLVDSTETPSPIFGRVVGDDGSYSRDGLVYITFTDGSESKDSIVYSSTTNDDGGWYVDAANARDSEGNSIFLELTNDSFKARGIYSNYGSSSDNQWVLGYFNGAYPDIKVTKQEKTNALVNRVLAVMVECGDGICSGNEKTSCPDDCPTRTTTPPTTTPTTTTPTTTTPTTTTPTTTTPTTNAGDNGGGKTNKCDGATGSLADACKACYACGAYGNFSQIVTSISEGQTVDETTAKAFGYGNVAKIIAQFNGGTLTTTDMGKISGLGGTNACYNMNAIYGQTVCTGGKDQTNFNLTYKNGQVSGSTYCNSDGERCVAEKGKDVICSADTNCGSSGIVSGGTAGSEDDDCTTSDDCLGGLTCRGKKCVSPTTQGATGSTCNRAYDCNPGLICSGGKCTSPKVGSSGACNANADCGYKFICAKGHCEASASIASGGKCKSDLECGYQSVCGKNGICHDTKLEETIDCNVEYYINRGDPSSYCNITCGSSEAVKLSDTGKCARRTGVSYYNLTNCKTDEDLAITCNAKIPAESIGNLFDLSKGRISTLIAGDEGLDKYLENMMEEIKSGEADQWGVTEQEYGEYGYYCNLRGGESSGQEVVAGEGLEGETIMGYKNLACSNIPEGTNTERSGYNGVSKIYAESEISSDAYYLPEGGMYSFELGGEEIAKTVTGKSTPQILYIETNGIEGFQMPVDVNNPTSKEDYVLSASAYQITYTQESTAQQYEIKKGINIISFNFMPVSTELGAYTAKDVITQASKNGVEIQYITTFDGGRWSGGYSCSSDTCTGTNFTIVPGKGYLVYATDEGTITIPGYNLESSIPVAFSAGWNLIGVHGYKTAYTARTLLDSINTISGLTGDNVSWWPTSKGKYEGLSLDNGTAYGLDFPISPTNGYFVRISKYSPEDTKCKSLIWQPGGTLNGTCGNTK